MPITVALDQDPEDPRPFIEEAGATHPSLIDTEHALADLYGIVNVPTLIWIDEQGRMVKPHDVAFATNTFQQFHGMDAGPFLASLRRWVNENDPVFDPDAARAKLMAPSREEQLARAEFSLAWHLHQAGRTEAAERHFERAIALSPWDFTIRRGSMPIRGKNPFGPEFFEFAVEWDAAGKPYYEARPPAE